MKKITLRNRGYRQSRRITRNISDMGGDFVVRLSQRRGSPYPPTETGPALRCFWNHYIHTSLFKNSVYMDQIKLHMLISSFLSEPSHISIWFIMLYTLVLLVSGAGHR